MRTFLFIFISLVLFGCEKDDIQPIVPTPIQVTDTTKTSTTSPTVFYVDVPGEINSDYAHHVSPMTYYQDGGNEYILLSRTASSPTVSYPTIQLKKVNGSWVNSKTFNDCQMGIGRNYEFTRDGIVYADHGYEGEPRPFGDLYYGKFNNGDINWTKISVGNGKSFYHDVSTGDINGDGLTDVVGIHMGIKNHDWGATFHTFTQTTDGKFVENRNLVNHDKGGYNWYNSNGAIQVQDLNNDGRPEIIKATYGKINSEKRYSILIYSFNKSSGQYEVVSETTQLGIYDNPNIGTTSIQTNDFDKDGDVDLALAFEGEYTGIQIYRNNGNFNFTTSSDDILKFNSPTNSDPMGDMEFREFNLVDFDNDGDLDVVLNPFHNGKKFRSSDKTSVYLENLFWRNDGTKFSQLQTKIEVKNVNPDFLKGYMVNGVFKFIGTKSDFSANRIGIYEITVPKELLK